ncbi:aminoacyl--tRNA ligase-related protein [Candidatus Absconditicoccus praedator]|uniref:aminoacyl--tRNA ligase-related protein n=1 Tax=Candidatus Absconditicoccus praedator TaxID=2735562 RepID=UPI001E5A4443|nr:aminoacyl--tRNA ligase-related protein [Candidatus Absconditicoccus praedator]UFX83479.1 prolyl-tRNA synthetase [Candidatus Absconditicoccus praedator]
MRLSNYFVKTSKQSSEEEKSINAQLLTRGGFVRRNIAGVYTYLPFGLRVLRKIENIVREEMNKIGGNEVFMPVLSSKANWEATGRWDEIDVLYKLEGAGGHMFALNSTHEEIITPIAEEFIKSYKDLPRYIYQIQTKFRNEKRAKSGLLRGREFSMKDLYSFHENEKDLDEYFELVSKAYRKIFDRVGLGKLTYEVEAPGGDFSDKPSIEFQTLTNAGEDNIWIDTKTNYAINEELAECMTDIFDIVKEGENISSIYSKKIGRELEKRKAAEVGNIFKLYDRFSKAFNLFYQDKTNSQELVQMGCYGIGTSRLMGVVVEVFNDEKGIIWPENIAPYKYDIIPIGETGYKKAEEIYNYFEKCGIEAVLDDRKESPGYRLKDADLVGFPYKIVVSDKTLSSGENIVEVINRQTGSTELIDYTKIKK